MRKMSNVADGFAAYHAAYCRGLMPDPDPVRDALAAAEHALEEKALDAMAPAPVASRSVRCA